MSTSADGVYASPMRQPGHWERASGQRDIAVSLHAPYYISMSSLDEEKRLGSLRYILESAGQ